MKNYVQHGDNVTFTAPSGGVTSGVPVLIGDLLVVPVASADEGDDFAGQITGVYDVTKVGSQAWTEGATVYWDDGNSRFTTTASGSYKAGVAVGAVGSGAGETAGVVRFDGIATSQEA